MDKGGMYKIFFKVLSIRLKLIMNDINSHSEGAFIKVWPVTDGILVANEYVDTWWRMVSSCLAYKLDLEKAYDCVDWGFL